MNASTESESQITQLQQENELLLHQLHQVQEELEHYYLLCKGYEAKNQALQTSGQTGARTIKVSQPLIEKMPKNLMRILRRTYLGKMLIIKHSGFFDETWYLQAYPDVAEKRKNPVFHYLRHGAREGRNPGSQFDTQWYLAANPDVAEKGVNPLYHYILFGQHEGRLPKYGGIQPPPDPFENERRRLTQARNEQARLASERQYRIDQLTQTNYAANKQIKEQQDSIKNLVEERDQLALKQSQLQSDIQQLVQARDDQARLAAEYFLQVEQLTALKAEAELQAHENQNQIAKLAIEKNEQAKLAEDRLQRIKQLETELADTQVRQILLNEEMIKAEAQIDLIKEMLFKE